MDIKYVRSALAYAAIGLALGLHMIGSRNHGQMVTHAHILLLGFVVNFIYALCYKLWLGTPGTKLALAQYYFHQIGTLVLLITLFLQYGHFVSEKSLGPVSSTASFAVFIGLILMIVLFYRKKE